MFVIKPFRFLPSIKRKDTNPDFADYSWFKGLFNEEEVNKIKELWHEEEAKAAEVLQAGEKKEKDDLRKSRIIFIKPGGANDWIYDKLSQACIQTNTNRYKFEILGYQTELQLASYSEGDFFDWHMDFGMGDISNRKLSITVQLSDSDEYEGGDLQFMVNQNIVTAPRDKGTAIVFPSFALHRVTPVTSGNRKSIVGWIAGPPYR
jgi:PKHD-type hydroxylase